MDQLANIAIAIVLVSLRLGPSLVFAPPFTLLRIPVLIRVMLSVGLAIWLISARPDVTLQSTAQARLVPLMLGEVLIGISIALGLQITFGAIYWAGRALDVQAGFGLAMLADPTTSAQLPLAGTVLSYAAGMVFFAVGGHYDLIGLWAASFETLPVGYADSSPDIASVGRFLSMVFFLAIGLVGIALITIFLADLVIAFLSRTLPQMNVLLLGFQVKAMLMVVTLPLCMSFAFALFLRMVRLAVTEPGSFMAAAP